MEFLCRGENQRVSAQDLRKGREVGIGYELAYRLRITPWEEAGRIFGNQIEHLLGPGVTPPGKALDVGCGAGDHAIELARRGWEVTGIDMVQLALDRARRKARNAGVDVRFVHSDATDLHHTVGHGFELVLDVGCFHGLGDEGRAAYSEGMTEVTVRGATLLMFAFGHGHRGPLPRGVRKRDISRNFPAWDLVADLDADLAGMPGPLRSVDPRWFRLVRR
ncbi:class I SAM-dependent methyltransferase [Rhodococcus sp. NPDC058521]|uniref:class I SAM-dependent methyltransferase n=1 Tax=Rhodococcus sp. NPDC058521 TaxID=3346536 RepID=UPI0036555BFD